MSSFQTTRRVEFRDTDAAGIMHFSAFFTMMESVEHELLRSLGTSVVTQNAAGQTISWPRVAARCEYRGAAHFEDILDVSLTIGRLGKKSVTYEYAFSRAETPIAEGHITAVCCRLGEHKQLESIPIPAELRTSLARFTDA
jgi:acyl-CoA thioester hydrolase